MGDDACCDVHSLDRSFQIEDFILSQPPSWIRTARHHCIVQLYGRKPWLLGHASSPNPLTGILTRPCCCHWVHWHHWPISSMCGPCLSPSSSPLVVLCSISYGLTFLHCPSFPCTRTFPHHNQQYLFCTEFTKHPIDTEANQQLENSRTTRYIKPVHLYL